MKGDDTWTTVEATHLKPNNEVDRVAEIKGIFIELMPDHVLLDAVAVGAIVYCLAESTNIHTVEMFVAQTSASTFGGRRLFSTSIYEESEALFIKHADRCPKRLLKKLSAPPTPQAADWRKRCMKRAVQEAECRHLQRTGFKRD